MAAQTAPPAPSTTDPIGESYRRYALGLLLAVYTLNFVDRQILSILLEPIKQEIQLSDGQLGLLGGIAFALFYTFAGIPIARWADRGSRRTIIALAMFTWSLMTAATGLARGFGGLLAARIGVGIGEAGCSPPAHSLISDYFPPERRGTALSIYALGIPIGAAIGTFTGGWIGEFFGWRTAFLVVGLPGVALALVVRLTLREPPRGHSDGAAVNARAAAPESVASVLAFILRLRSFRHLAFAASLHAFAGYGAAYFLPSFFIRLHGFGLAEIASWLALLGLSAGLAGTYLGGKLADTWGARDERWYLWVPAIATILGVPASALFYLWPDPYWALVLAFPAALLAPMYLGPSFAVTQGLVKVHMRALASAVLLFIINLIGLGLGPYVVGLLSDALRPDYGAESIRYALLSIVLIGNAWSALHYALAARSFRADMRRKEEDTTRITPSR